MNTHVFTAVTDDWLPLWDLVRPNWEEYCQRHGYTLHVQREFDASMPFTFAKIKAALEYFEDNYIGAFWVVDADIVFTNMKLELEDFVNATVALSMTKDINGINSGVFRIHQGGYSKGFGPQWMKTIVALRNVFRSEQDAIQALEETYSHRLVQFIGHPSFNSIVLDEYPIYAGKYTEKDGNWAPGHLLAHFPGQSMEGRLALIPKYLAQVVR